MPEYQKIKRCHNATDSAEPFEQQKIGPAGVEGVKVWFLLVCARASCDDISTSGHGPKVTTVRAV